MVGRGDEEGDLRGEGVRKQAMSRGTPYNSDNATPPAATSVTKKASKRATTLSSTPGPRIVLNALIASVVGRL